MSDQENENQVTDQAVSEVNEVPADVDTPKASANNLIATLLALKEGNPKIFFGLIGGVVLILLFLLMSGGESGPSNPGIKNLAVGQQYVLKSANAYDTSSTVRLVSVPGAIAAYDDTEEADRNGACQHMAQGTAVSVLDFADAYGKKNAYAKVRIEDGECKGNEGWALTIDIQ